MTARTAPRLSLRQRSCPLISVQRAWNCRAAELFFDETLDEASQDEEPNCATKDHQSFNQLRHDCIAPEPNQLGGFREYVYTARLTLLNHLPAPVEAERKPPIQPLRTNSPTSASPTSSITLIRIGYP